jgi:hypothetical protein
MVYDFTANIIGTLGCNALQGRMANWHVRQRRETLQERTFEVSVVSPAEFSLVCLPLCGPTFGLPPFASSSSTFFIVPTVKSSYTLG